MSMIICWIIIGWVILLTLHTLLVLTLRTSKMEKTLDQIKDAVGENAYQAMLNTRIKRYEQ
jgi:hypothetical protein